MSIDAHLNCGFQRQAASQPLVRLGNKGRRPGDGRWSSHNSIDTEVRRVPEMVCKKFHSRPHSIGELRNMHHSKWMIAGASGLMLSTVASDFALASTTAKPGTLIVSEKTLTTPMRSISEPLILWPRAPLIP